MQEAIQREAWGAALARAKGDRVLDDPKKLRRSIKAEGKAREKRAGVWKERAGRPQEEQAAKQRKCAPPTNSIPSRLAFAALCAYVALASWSSGFADCVMCKSSLGCRIVNQRRSSR